MFAPYLNTWDNPIKYMNEAFTSAGVKYFHVAFVIADQNGNPGIDGNTDEPFGFSKALGELRSNGGDVIFSFGGAGGKELATVTASANELYNKYKSVVDKYSLKMLDFDIEGNALPDRTTNDRRNQALAMLQKTYTYLSISYTLPASFAVGVKADSIALLQSAMKYGVNLASVNLMTMSYYSNIVDMGKAAIDSALKTKAQLDGMGMKAKIGICPMIGKNDSPEIFSLEHARAVLKFAESVNWIDRLSFWALQRDQGVTSSDLNLSSGIPQKKLEFSNIFVQFK
jgi:chitinase